MKQQLISYIKQYARKYKQIQKVELISWEIKDGMYTHVKLGAALDKEFNLTDLFDFIADMTDKIEDEYLTITQFTGEGELIYPQ